MSAYDAHAAHFTGLAFLLRYGWWKFRERYLTFLFFFWLDSSSIPFTQKRTYISGAISARRLRNSHNTRFYCKSIAEDFGTWECRFITAGSLRATPLRSTLTYFTTIAQNEAARSKISISAKIWHFIWPLAEMPRWDVKM